MNDTPIRQGDRICIAYGPRRGSAWAIALSDQHGDRVTVHFTRESKYAGQIDTVDVTAVIAR